MLPYTWTRMKSFLAPWIRTSLAPCPPVSNRHHINRLMEIKSRQYCQHSDSESLVQDKTDCLLNIAHSLGVASPLGRKESLHRACWSNVSSYYMALSNFLLSLHTSTGSQLVRSELIRNNMQISDRCSELRRSQRLSGYLLALRLRLIRLGLALCWTLRLGNEWM